MKAKLQVINGPEDGREYHMKKKVNYLGRIDGNDVVVALDNQISRRHAVIKVEDYEIWLEDLDSRNGTFVNEDQIEEPYLLSPEEVFRIGKTYFQLIIE